jgi:hypothetical protein
MYFDLYKESGMNSPESQTTPIETRVRDPLVRLFHWSLVVTFTVAWLTADEEPHWHDLSGYIVTGLVVFRIVWGFDDTRYARFNDFVYSPATVRGYTRDLLTGKARRYLGHNPPGKHDGRGAAGGAARHGPNGNLPAARGGRNRAVRLPPD